MRADSTGRKRGCGCLTGCLVTILILIIGIGVALFFGTSWLITQAQERIPALALVKNAMLSLQGERSGSQRPEDLPRHVHVPDGADSAAFRTQGDAAFAVLRFEERSAASLVRELRTQMRAQGWKTRKNEPLTGGTRLRFTKGRQRCQIEVLTSGQGSEVWTQWHQTAPQ